MIWLGKGVLFDSKSKKKIKFGEEIKKGFLSDNRLKKFEKLGLVGEKTAEIMRQELKEKVKPAVQKEAK